MQKSISVTLTAKKDQGSQNYENCLLFRQETAGNRRGRVMHGNRVSGSVENIKRSFTVLASAKTPHTHAGHVLTPIRAARQESVFSHGVCDNYSRQ